MKTMKWTGLLCLLAALFAVVQPGHAEPKIASAVLARAYVKGEAQGITNTFKPSDREQHCVVKLDRISKLTARAVWTAVNAGGMKNYKIMEKTMPSQLADQVHFNISLPRNWPVGQYRTDLYINGKLARSLPYSVK